MVGLRPHVTAPAIAMVLVVSVALSGCLSPSEEGRFQDELDLEHPVGEDMVLDVVSINGDIDIGTGQGDRIIVNAVRRSWTSRDQLEAADVVITEEGGLVTVEVVFNDEATDVTVDLNIQLPPVSRVGNVSSTNGNVDVMGVRGDLAVSTSNGFVSVFGIAGFVSASTSNGRIEVGDVTGIRNITCLNGDINIEVQAIDGETEVSTTNGGVSLSVDPEVDADVVITTVNGNIDFHETVLSTTLVQGTRVEGTVGEGGVPLRVSTVNGDAHFYELV